ncbi:MAG: hypothetical protein QM586_18330 [Xenophilus sp.]
MLTPRLATLALALVCAGCVPWPHSVQIAPTVSGVVLDHGRPAPGVLVHWHTGDLRPAGDGCRPSPSQVRTDAQGRFHLEGKKDFRTFSMMGDRLIAWRICIERDGVIYTGWQARAMGAAPEQVRMRCDFSDGGSAGGGICRSDDAAGRR